MKETYVLDACALIACMAGEEGAETVRGILERASENNAEVMMHQLNLLEVYYDILRRYGNESADDFLAEIRSSPIAIVREISDKLLRKAGYFKANYKISLADAIALAAASTLEAALITSDHHEFDIVEKMESLCFLWIR